MQEYLKHANANDVMDKDSFVEACLNCRWKFDRELRLQEFFHGDESNQQTFRNSKKVLNQFILRVSEFLAVNKNARKSVSKKGD